MVDVRIGRLLVASLHQAITELLPARLEFYEEWLRPSGMRDGRIGLAPVQAVLSFLRQDGAMYEPVVERAGRLTAEWWLGGTLAVRRRAAATGPVWIRGRVAMGLCRDLVRQTFRNSLVTTTWRRGEGRITLGGSVFCGVRAPAGRVLCGFYVSAVTAVLQEIAPDWTVEATACRAVGGGACVRRCGESRPARLTPRMTGGHETEPPLHGKQLVFVFMAATVAAVVVFLSGVMVGRGVRLQRGGLAYSEAAGDLTLDAAPPLAAPTGATAQGPSPASRENLSYPSQLSELNPPDVLPEPAEDPTANVLGRVPALDAAQGTGDRVRELTRAKDPARAGPEASAPGAPGAADAGAGTGFAVQVAAVRDRTVADKIAARLKAKGYPAYITSPAPGMFRVRVGKFQQEREAAATAERLQKEEQFKPWITK